MPAPAFGAAGAYLAGAVVDSAAVAVPAGVTAGQIIEVYLYLENGGNAVTPPDGTWTEVASVAVTGAQAHWIKKFWKRATAADSGTYTFTWTGPTAWREGVAIRYTGATGSGSPYAGAHSTALDATTTDGITPAVSVSSGVEYLAIWTGTNANGGAWTPPSGFVERADNSSDLSVATLAFNNGGSTGSVTGTCATSGAGGAILGAMIGPSDSAPPPRRRSPVMSGPWSRPQPKSYGDSAVAVESYTHGSQSQTTPGDRPTGSKAASGSVSDSITPTDRPAGTRTATGSTTTSATISDVSTGARVTPGGATRSDTVVSDRPTGAKGAVRAITDGTTPADSSLGTKTATKPISDGTTPNDRPASSVKSVTGSTSSGTTPADRPGVGTKATARSTVDSVTAIDRPGPGTKATTRTTADTFVVSDRPTTGLTRTGSTSSSVTAGDQPGTGAKATTRTTADSTTSTDRSAGSKTGTRSTLDSIPTTDRPVGTKAGVGSARESVTLVEVITGRKLVIRNVSSSCVPVDGASGVKGGRGVSWSSITPDDWTTAVYLFRDITVHSGRLGERSIGRLVSELAGIVRNRNRTGRSRGAAPEGGTRGRP